MQGVDGAPRQRVIFGEQVREDLVVAPAIIGQHGDDAGDVLGNRALIVEEGRRHQAVAVWVAPGNELARIKQVKDAGDDKVELFCHLIKRQQLLISKKLGQFWVGIVLRVRGISHRHNCSGITLRRADRPYWNP